MTEKRSEHAGDSDGGAGCGDRTDEAGQREASTVRVDVVVTRRGKRVEISSPEFDQSVSLDAIALECLTWTGDREELLRSLWSEIDSPELDTTPAIEMPATEVEIINEYAQVVVESVEGGLWVHASEEGRSRILDPVEVFELTYLENSFAFSDLLRNGFSTTDVEELNLGRE